MSVAGAAGRIARRTAGQALPTHVSYLRRARMRLTAWYLGVLLLLLVAVGVAVYMILAEVLSNEVDSDLKAVASSVADRGALTGSSSSAAAPALTGEYPDVFLLLLDQRGLIVSNPRNMTIAGLPDALAVQVAQSGRTDLRRVDRGGQPLRLLTRPLYANGQISGIVEAGKSLRTYQQEIHAIELVLAGGGLAALLLAGIGGTIIAGKALRPAQLSWQRQQAFVADASHELRTPLALVRANAEVLLRSPDQTIAQNRELVEDIIQEADHLGNLVSDMLTLARLDGGRLPLQPTEFDPRTLLEEVASQTRRLIEQRSIMIRVDAPLGLRVMADRERIRQVIRILVDNALRFTPDDGQVVLECSRGSNTIRFAVTDSGRGIEPKDLPHIFERFYRGDRSRSRAGGGAGLGLAIARGIVEAHNGRIRAESELGRGTKVIVEIPAA